MAKKKKISEKYQRWIDTRKRFAFDSHKRYTFASVEEHTGNVLKAGRINHCRGAITEFLSAWKSGTEVAVETIGNWYWIVDEIEAAGMVPRLVHARRAKMMLASVNKTDKLEVLARQRARCEEPYSRHAGQVRHHHRMGQ